MGSAGASKPLGYSFILAVPNDPTNARDAKPNVPGIQYGLVAVDIDRLIIQCFVIALLAGAGIATTVKSRKGNSEAG